MKFKRWLIESGEVYLGDIWMTQRNLNRIAQIPAMIKEIRDEGILPLIEINETPDGSYEIQNGHHRASALWNAGVLYIDRNHYKINYTEYPKRRFWQVKNSPYNSQIQNMLNS